MISYRGFPTLVFTDFLCLKLEEKQFGAHWVVRKWVVVGGTIGHDREIKASAAITRCQ